MDSKQIKNNLKQAREFIKNKQVTSAIDLCKAVLKEDRNNYLALVLLGAAFQESEQREQAPNAFRKAIDVLPNEIPAWQGLSKFYEKEDCSKHATVLVPIYQRLLQLEKDSSKWSELTNKLKGVVTKCDCDEIMNAIVTDHEKSDDKNKITALRGLLIHYLSHAEHFANQSLQLYEDFLNKSATDSEANDFEVLFKLLYQQKKAHELLRRAEKVFEKYSSDSVFCEWVCKVSSEMFVEDRSWLREHGWCERLPQCYQSILETDEDNVLALLTKSVCAVERRAYLEARDCLSRCMPLNKGLFVGICLQAEVNLHLLCLDLAKLYTSAALKLRPEHTLTRAIVAKALALSDDSRDWEKALNLASELGDAELAVETRCKVYLSQGKLDLLDTELKQMTHAPGLAELWRVEARAQAGQDLLTLLAQQTPECPEAWFRLGQLQEQAGEYSLACTSFLKCAKLAPYWYTVFHELGGVYARDAALLDKARRCFQHALVLNRSHIPTQMALSDIYSAIGDADSNLRLLLSVTQTEEGRWAWARLGLQYSRLGDTSSAINCLCSALKADPHNSSLLEALADAYLTRGANGSALKTYQKVLEIKPGAFYPALQIATIKQMTDLPEESLLEFRQLVVQQPDSLLALKGLCDTCLCLARNFVSRRLLGLARDRVQEGLEATARGIELRPELACLWKLAGDCLTMAGSLPSSWQYLDVPQNLLPKSKEKQTLQSIQLLQLGVKCMCRSVKLMPESGRALVWHDLSLNYWHQARLAPTDSAELSEKALAASKQSVTLDPARWQHWNQLGAVAALPCIKNYALAQHAFIKATILDETVAAPWSNLGCLYLSLGDLKLANKAFSAAQRVDSEFCPSWVGQALIAEQVKNDETMDLFRHTTLLGFHPESCVGYAQWVCRTLGEDLQVNDPHYVYSIEKMHAVPSAIDALTWATDENEEDVCALNMLGCLLERCSLYRTSVEVLSRAVDHSPPAHRDKVLANFGRVLLKAEKIEDAIEVYKAIAKFDIHSQCGLALALYKGKQYEEASEAYKAALDWWAADDGVKAHLYVALAAVAYKTGNLDGAKTLLLQGNQLKPTSVQGLFAACALGMIEGDLELSKLALRDLFKYQHHLEHLAHIALFQAYIKFIQGDVQGMVWSMSKTVHRQPTQAPLWLHLALLILSKQDVKRDAAYKVCAAAQCARVAITLGRTCMDISKVPAVISLGKLLSGEARSALSASQHAVHLYPGVGESWAVLAASCYTAQSATPLRPLISHARQHTDLQRPLAKWMSNFERKIALLAPS